MIIFTLVSYLIFILSLTMTVHGKEYHFARRIRAVNGDMFGVEFLKNQDIKDCIESCKMSKACKYVNFEIRTKLCFLISVKAEYTLNVENYVEVKPGFYFGDKNEWAMEKYEICEDCNEFGKCSIDDHSIPSKCFDSGCGSPEEKKNAKILGNMFSIGNKVEYKCVEGYKSTVNGLMTSECLINGTWSFRSVECRPGDDYIFNGASYKLIREAQNWDLANKACLSMDWQLVDIRSEDEQNFIRRKITAVHSFVCYWTGGKRSEGGFIWPDGTMVERQSWNWNHGQPNNVRNIQNCVELLQKFDYKWNDGQCTRECFVICKRTYQ